MAEGAPRQVLIDAHVLLVEGEGRLERSLRLLKVFLLLIEEANLDERVHLLLHAEAARQDRVLEEFARLVDLICLRKDSAKLVEHLGFLVEVG